MGGQLHPDAECQNLGVFCPKMLVKFVAVFVCGGFFGQIFNTVSPQKRLREFKGDKCYVAKKSKILTFATRTSVLNNIQYPLWVCGKVHKY